VPNQPGGSNASANTAAINSAKPFHDAGIPIYAIGLAQNQAVADQETILLNQICTGGTDKFIPVSNPQNLNDAFQTIARQLVVLK
jgi:hypothetical protein